MAGSEALPKEEAKLGIARCSLAVNHPRHMHWRAHTQPHSVSFIYIIHGQGLGSKGQSERRYMYKPYPLFKQHVYVYQP